MDSEHAESDTLIANADPYDTGQTRAEHHASVEGEKFTVERVAGRPRTWPARESLAGRRKLGLHRPAHISQRRTARVVKHALSPGATRGMREIIRMDRDWFKRDAVREKERGDHRLLRRIGKTNMDRSLRQTPTASCAPTAAVRVVRRKGRVMQAITSA